MANIPLKTIQFPDLPDTYVVAPPIEATASGAIASFTDGADDLPVAELTVAIVPKQAGSGTPSPSNVRAISGFTKATIKRAGKNLYNNIISADTCSNNNGASHTSSDGILTITPKVDTSASNSGVYFSYSASTLWNAVYMLRAAELSATLSFEAKASVLPVQMRVGTTGASSYPTLTTDWVRYSTTIPASDVGAICFYANRLAQSSVISIRNVMVSVGDAGAYEPYTADTYEVSFGSAGTVYGGTLDVTTGKLTVDKVGLTLTGEESWASLGSGNSLFFRLTLDGRCGADTSQSISSHYPLAQIISATTVTGFYAYSSGSDLTHTYIQFRPDLSQINTVASWKQFLAAQYSAETPVTCVYPLYTPIEVNLTPLDTIRTLYGANNIWSDTGDATVTYCADTKLYIDGLIAETQALILES